MNQIETNNNSNASEGKNVTEDDEEMEDQLQEYKELLDELGNHADKVTINLLTMVAEDHASSAKAASALYQCIRALLLSPSTHPERKLPLVYVIDSILKNVKQEFISLIEADALSWIPVVYHSLHNHTITKPQTSKLKKVLHTWKDFRVFPNDAVVQKMISCFDDTETNLAVNKIDSTKASGTGEGGNSGKSSSGGGHTSGDFSSATTTNDVLENVSGPLRIKMQNLLDEIHSDVDELEKVSLERLAAINPSLLEKIKSIAIGEMAAEHNAADAEDPTKYYYPNENSIFADFISKEHMKRSQDWMKIPNTKAKAGDLVSDLQQHVMNQSKMNTSNNQNITVNPGLIAAASATANHISLMLQFLQNDGSKTNNNTNNPSSFLYSFFGHGNNCGVGSVGNTNAGSDTLQRNMKLQTKLHTTSSTSSLSFLIDKTLFTTEDIAKKMTNHDRIVAMLYEEGLPFLSTSDGRRFKTQLELSNHLDFLFRKSQLEKTMERAEERGWHISTLQWSCIQSDTNSMDDGNTHTDRNDGSVEGTSDKNNIESTTVHADENRSRCVICGNPFEMFFDQEVGDHMYKNCREIELLNDEAAEEESENTLVHIKCWQGLGLPEFLTMDQVLQS